MSQLATLDVMGTGPPALIEAVLNGDASYDELDDMAQAAVRVHWEDEIERRRLSLDLAREFSERGVAWAEADAGGKVILSSATRASST